MSFTIYIGHAFKRFNSTSQPDYSGWLETNAVWKNAKDLDSPTIELYLPDVSSPDWNYMYIPSQQAYYWITAITTVRANTWQVSGVMDTLATYRNQIIGTTCFIEYGFNTDASGAQYRLQDTRQNVSMVPQISTVTADITGGMTDTESGIYMLSAVGASGGVTVWKLAKGGMNILMNSINNDIVTEIENYDNMEDVLKFFTANSLSQGSAIQAIRSCIWLPMKGAAFPSDANQNIFLGDFDTGVLGGRQGSNPIYKAETDIAIPWPVSDWKRMNCQILMYVPYVGTVAVPVDQCNDATSLHITWCVEAIGGTVSIRIEAGDYTVYTGSTSIGTPYAVGSSNVPIQNAISGTVQAIGGAMEFGGGLAQIGTGAGTMAATMGVLGGDTLASGISQAGSGLAGIAGGAMQALTPVVQCAGSLGGCAAAGQSQQAKLTLLYYPPIDDTGFQTVYGHPVMRIGTPVAGYLNAGARASELGTINAMMDGGVFIE